MFLRSAAVTLAVATSLVLAGCGSSSDSSGSGALARADLAKKADSICAAAKRTATALTPPTDFATNSKAAAGYLQQVAQVTQTEASDLAALRPDSDASADFAALVKAQNNVVALLGNVASKARAKDRTGLTELATDGAAATKTFVGAAAKVGAKGCAAG